MKNLVINSIIAIGLLGAGVQARVDVQELCQPMTDVTKRILTNVDQEFCSFNYKKKDKYPMFIHYMPGPDKTVKTVMCGTRSATTGNVMLVTSSKQLALVTPVRMFIHDVGPNMKVDEKYLGLRETLLGKAVDRIAYLTILNKKEYKGQILISEYNAENVMPMYIKLGDLEDFRALRSYLESGIKSRADKPLLLLKIVKQGNDSLTQGDKDFLMKNFTLLDENDCLVREFFEKSMNQLKDAQNKFGDARPVGEKFGDLVMGGIEKECGEFKKEKLALIVGKMLIAGWGVKMLTGMAEDWYFGKTPITREAPKFNYSNKDAKDTFDKACKYCTTATISVLGAVAVAVLSSMAYEASCSEDAEAAA